jgi:indolepyruvate ferredoxin oxidoreductase beta subunit
MEGKDPVNLIVTGVGGQGNVLISQLLGKALVSEGHHVTIGETYGASQRGGAVMSHVRISRKEQYGPFIPEGRADVVLGLEPVETLRVLAQYGQPEVTVIANSRPVYTTAITTGAAEYPGDEEIEKTLKALSRQAWLINATEIALEMGAPILANIIMAGALIGSETLPLDLGALERQLRESLPGDKLEMNLVAIQRGLEEARSRSAAEGA